MPRISTRIEKLENKLSAKLHKHKRKLEKIWPFLLIGLYFYGVFVNSIRLGISSTFGDYTNSIWEWNPILSIAAIFTPTGLGITFFLILITCLITKKGYTIFSGYRFVRDPRGFDILPEATHGGSGWMNEKQIEAILQKGKAGEIDGTILGKAGRMETKIIPILNI